MNRADALPYVSFFVDDAQNAGKVDGPAVPPGARLVGWQLGFEPLFVAVWSYLDVNLDDSDAEELAMDYLVEIGWFSDGRATPITSSEGEEHGTTKATSKRARSRSRPPSSTTTAAAPTSSRAATRWRSRRERPAKRR